MQVFQGVDKKAKLEDALPALKKMETFYKVIGEHKRKSLHNGENNTKHINTYLSLVVLTGNYAFKFKKSVKFEFLDFSTLKLRKHFCEQEVSTFSFVSRETIFYFDK